MRDFLTSSNLYEKYTIGNVLRDLDSRLISPFYFNGKTYDYSCEKEGGKITTFSLELQEESKLLQDFEGCGMDTVPDSCIVERKLNYTIHLKGRCRSCNDYCMDLVLNIFSEEYIPGFLIGPRYKNAPEPTPDVANFDFPIYVQKIGVNPKMAVIPKKEITKFFDRESGVWYFKGINALSQNYGIGALAYFRRIIEKELLHIVKQISELPDAHEMEIQKLLDEHEQKSTVCSIYDNIFEHLPNSLKGLGDNPIKLLYNQTSEGLHSLTEEQALEKSDKIQKLLEFVIIKIYEERSNIKDLKEVIKGLKS